MRQIVRQSVAPNNPNPKWPQGYVAVLREVGAQEKQIPFNLNWVRRFFAANPRLRQAGGPPRLKTQDLTR